MFAVYCDILSMLIPKQLNNVYCAKQLWQLNIFCAKFSCYSLAKYCFRGLHASVWTAQISHDLCSKSLLFVFTATCCSAL